MFRLAISMLGFVIATAAAHAQTGEPFSAERHAYCEAGKSTCLRQTRTQCNRSRGPVVHRQCIEDIQTSCSKDFERCFVAQSSRPAEAAAPPLAPISRACASLFASLRSAPSVSMLWTTNYFAHGERFMGWTSIELRWRGPDLAGDGRRLRTRPSASGGGFPIGEAQREVNPQGPEHVSIVIRGDGRIVFQGIYGPYEPMCWGDRFAAVHTGDSLETFNFKPGAP